MLIRMNIYDIAKVCHELNRAYCQSIGDNSQLPFEEAPQWQQDSLVAGVNFRLANPDAPASAQHDAWMADKLSHGWKHGPVKDPEAREHPCIVPYEELPREQKSKDYIFRAVVDQLKGFLDDAI